MSPCWACPLTAGSATGIDDAIATIGGARVPCRTCPVRVTLGGDQTAALPMLGGVGGAGPVAVVHFDAHLDTWDTYFGAAYPTHAVPPGR